MAKLTEAEIAEQMKALSGWKYAGGEITRSFEFPDFAAAFAFVTQVALKAEASAHHPDIDIRYNKVRLGLVSHDAGGVTSRDVKFAAAVNQLKP
jgi:4a-hydroxytetrahydrobiopterin dehydratase